jgi:pyruvate/2-oxoacid:ferredoxin oxidoreductase beta subunit
MQMLSINQKVYCLAANHDLKLEIAKNMRTYGGSFVQALAECLVLADPSNLQKIESAFNEYLQEYDPSAWKKR